MSSRQLRRGRSGPVLGTDDTGCYVLHVDMDAFFVGVELRELPHLRGQPVIIGRKVGRGVVLSASYEARALGVHSAMPMGRARRLCPQAVVIEPTREKYLSASRDVMKIFQAMTPEVDVVSIDEAFLDVRSVARAVGSPTTVAHRIRQRVWNELDLTCSVGVAAVTMVAKAASTIIKPDGMLVVPRAQTVEFLHSLPVGAVWGVGAKTESQLETLGVVTVGELAALPPHRLQRTVGKAAGQRLAQLAAGLELRPIRPQTNEKSIGSEVTFDVDQTQSSVIERELRGACEGIARRLRGQHVLARQVSLKVRFDDFTTVNRSHTLAQPGDVAGQLYAPVLQMWSKILSLGRPVRLVGVRVEQLSPASSTGHQLSLDAHASQLAVADKVVDQLAARFGPRVVIPARMLHSDPPD